MNKDIIHLLKEELRLNVTDSPYISRMLENLNYCRDMTDLVTLLSQTIIALDSSRNQAEKTLIDIVKRIGTND